MALFVYLIFMLIVSFATAAENYVQSKAASPSGCDDCVQSKTAFFASSSSLSSGACGYGSLALNFFGGHVAAALPSIYKNGAGCGACFQIRCKNSNLCSKAGTNMVVTDLHTDTSSTTAFVLSNIAFRDMALPGKDNQLLKLGIVDVDYKRIPCDYQGQNLALSVVEFSQFPNYLAIKVLYQGGQTEILSADVGSVGSQNWKSMGHNYGVVWDTSEAPTGPLKFRFKIVSGSDTQYFDTNQILPENWKPGVIYNSTVQIDKVAAHGCNPCGAWK